MKFPTFENYNNWTLHISSLIFLFVFFSISAEIQFPIYVVTIITANQEEFQSERQEGDELLFMVAFKLEWEPILEIEPYSINVPRTDFLFSWVNYINFDKTKRDALNLLPKFYYIDVLEHIKKYSNRQFKIFVSITQVWEQK